jgi:hypothetical protein
MPTPIGDFVIDAHADRQLRDAIESWEALQCLLAVTQRRCSLPRARWDDTPSPVERRGTGSQLMKQISTGKNIERVAAEQS